MLPLLVINVVGLTPLTYLWRRFLG